MRIRISTTLGTRMVKNQAIRRRITTLSDSLLSRAVDIRSDLKIPDILSTITSGPLESIKPSPADPLETLRVSFLHRSSASRFLENLRPTANLQVRFVGGASPLHAGITSAILLHGATRSLRVFARNSRRTHGLEDCLPKYGRLEAYPKYTSVQNNPPYVTCHYLDIQDSIKAFAALHDLPKDDLVGHVRFAADKCDTLNHYSRLSLGVSRAPKAEESDILERRKVILHGLAPGVTREDLEDTVGNTGAIQSLALDEQQRSATVAFLSAKVARTFVDTVDMHFVNKRRFMTEMASNSVPVSQRLKFALDLGVSRTIQLSTVLPNSSILTELLSRFAVPDKAALSLRLREDFEHFGTVNSVKITEDANSVYITFADIFRASRAVSYLAWPTRYLHSNKPCDARPYRGLTVTYAPAISYHLEGVVANPDGVKPVVVDEQTKRHRLGGKQDKAALTVKELQQLIHESFAMG